MLDLIPLIIADISGLVLFGILVTVVAYLFPKPIKQPKKE